MGLNIGLRVWLPNESAVRVPWLIPSVEGVLLAVLLLGGALGFGVLELALAPQESLAPVCVLLFLTGACYLLWGASALASLQLAAPEHLRGQAASSAHKPPRPAIHQSGS